MSDLIDRKFAIDNLMVVKRQNKACGQMLCADEDAIISWLEALPSAERTGRWIPVSERLPERHGVYLVTRAEHGWNLKEYTILDMATYTDEGWHKAEKVIAWMPLPEPYREVKE